MSDRPSVKRILILAANPTDTARRRFDEEVREIGDGIKRSQQRDYFELQQRWAVRPKDMRRALLDLNPQIIHFCGHGDRETGLAVEDDAGRVQRIHPQALVDFFQQFTGIECVLLNACYAEEQAEAISQQIPYVIGMSQAIDDRAAIEFAVGFYDALGAGRSYEQAFKMGQNAIAFYNMADHLAPRIKHRSDSNAPRPTDRPPPELSRPGSAPAASRAAPKPQSRANPAKPTERRTADRIRRPSAAAMPQRTYAELFQKIRWIELAIVLTWFAVGAWRWQDATDSQLQIAKAISGFIGGLGSGIWATIAQRQLTSTFPIDRLLLNCLIGAIVGMTGWLISTEVVETVFPGAMTGNGGLVGVLAGMLVAAIVLWRLGEWRR